MSKSEITQKQDYEESLRRAKVHLERNHEFKRLIQLLDENKIKKLTDDNEKKINELAQLGIVKLYMDNSITLSKLGKKLITITREIGI